MPSAIAGREDLSLVTDLYELTMAQAYFEHEMFEEATFSLFARRLPEQRSYLVAAGLEGALSFLENLHFAEEAIAYLDSTRIFSSRFLDYLRSVSFSGQARAIPEGRICFANEPLIEITAPIIEAQVVETYLINQLNFHTLIASKAARCFAAARGRSLVDFSLRRTHGVDAGLGVARATYIAGFNATSNVLAGKLYGIPLSGTMAHSFVTAHPTELDSFRRFAETFPDRTILLIDTYDTVDGARNAATVAAELASRGKRLRAVRLDSGDLLALSREVRAILDDAGFSDVEIFASGGLDEYEVHDLVQNGAPIDGFGVGTKVGTSADQPWLDTAYKMTEYAGRPVMKLSPEKASLPGRKQVFRRYGASGLMSGDVLALEHDSLDGEALLEEVMLDRERPVPAPTLAELRSRFQADFARLPDDLKDIRAGGEYAVTLSPELERLSRRAQKSARAASRPLGES